MEVIRLGLSGKMRSGKTTIAKHLVQHAVHRGYKGYHGATSAWLKMLITDGLGQKCNRHNLQTFGTEIIRAGCIQHFGNDHFWVRLLLHDFDRLQRCEGYNFFVCEDVRYLSDFKYLKNAGFNIIRLCTTHKHQMSRGVIYDKEHDKDKWNFSEETKSSILHSSETDLDKHEGLNFFDLETEPEWSIAQILEHIIPKVFPDV